MADDRVIATPPRAATSRRILTALFGLTFVTGIVDAVSFLGLGHVFTANMTGNVVFIGFALGGASDLSVLRSVVALLAFMAGGVAGGRIVKVQSLTAAARLRAAIAAETVLSSAAIVASAGFLPLSSTSSC
jgi:uncharacterized membrane protein YoaK (UPF0700 family)